VGGILLLDMGWGEFAIYDLFGRPVLLHLWMRLFQRWIKKVFESSLAIHLFFIGGFLIIFNLPGWLNDLPKGKLWRVVVYGLFILICIYSGRACNRRLLSRNMFQQFFLYSLSALVTLVLVGFIGLRVLTTNRVENSLFVTVVVVMTSFMSGVLLAIARSTILRQTREANAREEQMRSELTLLHAQLSPHFLFNMLNNLYGISISRYELVPDLLLKLSGLLRYSLYEVNEQFVPLGQEIEYIRNYVEFERLQIRDRLILEVEMEDPRLGVLVAPMLFIVFVENAFKHAAQSLESQVRISISLKLRAGWIDFSISNSYNQQMALKGQQKNWSGLGIANGVKRLEICYGKNYALRYGPRDDQFVVNLSLKVIE